MENALNGLAREKSPMTSMCFIIIILFLVTQNSKVPSFSSFYSPHEEQVLTWLDAQWEQITLRSSTASWLCPPPSSRATPSSICGLSLHQSVSLCWQHQEERECGPAAALIRGNLSGVQRAGALPYHFSQISGPPLYSFTSHSCTSAADGRALGKWRARGKPWAALVRWDCILSNVTWPWTW